MIRRIYSILVFLSLVTLTTSVTASFLDVREEGIAENLVSIERGHSADEQLSKRHDTPVPAASFRTDNQRFNVSSLQIFNRLKVDALHNVWNQEKQTSLYEHNVSRKDLWLAIVFDFSRLIPAPRTKILFHLSHPHCT